MGTIQVRLRHQIEASISLPSSIRRFFVPFSSPSHSDPNPRASNSFVDEAEGSTGVHRRALKFQRPTTVKWRPEFRNSASFIGTVIKPLKRLSAEYGSPRACTVLGVRNTPVINGNFRILLLMRGKTAEMCFEHLKENDVIYVSGPLGTFTKADADQNGKATLLFKITVEELNYVTGRRDSTSQSNQESQSSEGGLTGLERYKNRLHLWQVFFSSPYEWWDNRKDKVNPKLPDFKHKDTGEALWLSPNDPQWIQKQLQLLDSKMAEQGRDEPIGCRARVSKWEYDA